jgi:outer membrane protein assembly factor BamB
MVNMLKIFALIMSILIITSCSAMPSWLGGSESDAKDTSGPRISVLKVGTTVESDPTLSDEEVRLPEQEPTSQWSKSSGDHFMQPENIKIADALKQRNSVKIGAGAKDGQHLSATVIASDGKLFTVDSEAVVTAFSADNISKKIWQYKSKNKDDKSGLSNAGILVYEGKLFLTTGSNVVTALDSETGNLLWQRNINSMARSAPAASEKSLIVNTADNKIYALDINDGAIMWMHSGAEVDISVLGSTSPVVVRNVALAPYSSGELYALSLQDGEPVWVESLVSSASNVADMFSDIEASPLIVGDVLYAISDDGVLIAVDIGSGHRIWEKSISGSKTPWHAAGFLYVVNSNSELICLSAKNGAVKWVSKLPMDEKSTVVWSGPVLAGDKLFVVGSKGKLLQISPQNGAVVSTIKVPSDIYLPPVVVNEKMYLLNDKAQLIELGAK